MGLPSNGRLLALPANTKLVREWMAAANSLVYHRMATATAD
jgi:hypothetical protein